jgi:hypothetical protein
MPICEADPWRMQYFEHADCPPDVNIPTEDPDAWEWNPAYRWVYDKIAIAKSQGLEAGPHGTAPPFFPVFSKPIVNLAGMGVDTRILRSSDEYFLHNTSGHMWMALLEGRHVSSDVAIVAGAPRWWRHATGHSAGQGTFDYWSVHAGREAEIENYCGEWIACHLRGYTGMINIETIGGKMIEMHLRFSDQWPDLYGGGWLAALIGLYSTGRWDFADRDRHDGYSVVLFGPKGRRYRHPPGALVDELLRMPGVTSVQTTFHNDRDPERHAMPPGGFRLAIVNGWDLAVGFAARERLRAFHLPESAGAQPGSPRAPSL